MAAIYPNNLEVQINQPLDTKFVCDNLSDLTEYLYIGLITYCKNDKKYYSYKGTDSTGNHIWEELKTNITIPSKNLIKNSNFEDEDAWNRQSHWEMQGSYGIIISKGDKDGYNVLRLSRETTAKTFLLPFESGKTYTLSCLYKTSANYTVDGYLDYDGIGEFKSYYNIVSHSDNLTTDSQVKFKTPNEEYTRAYLTFEVIQDFEAQIAISSDPLGKGGNDQNLFISQIQLEEGYSSTEYVKYEDRITIEEAVTSKQDILISGDNIKTINGNSILGKGNIEINASDLGVSSPFYYLGVTTTEMEDGKTGATVIINNQNVIAEVGAVVFYDDKEYVYNGTMWEEFGSGNVSINYDTTLGDLATESAIGGIPKGTTADDLEGKTFTQLFDMLLFPDKDPSHTNPSVGNFALNPTTSPVAIGSATPSISTATLNKGYWKEYNKQSDNTNLPYTGDVTSTKYKIIINGTTFENENSLPSNLPTTFTTVGNHTYDATITYGAGPVPVNNKGVQRPSLAAKAGTVNATQRVVNVTRPFYLLGSGGMVEKLYSCTVGTNKNTIEKSSISHTVPGKKLGSEATVVKCYGTLTKLEVYDMFEGTADLLSKLVASRETDASGEETGYTLYKYPSTIEIGEVIILNIKIEF